MPQNDQFQIRLPEAELKRLAARVRDDYRQALDAHNRRMERYRRYFRNWRNRVEPNPQKDADAANYRTPLTKWHVQQKQAAMLGALFGDDAEIRAVPVGPSDQRKVRKISTWMTWRLLQSMKARRDLAVFMFRKILFGNAHAYMPWEHRSRTVGGKKVVDYDGPRWHNLWPDDFVVPAESARTLHDFSWVLRKAEVRFADLIIGEREGRYQNIEAHKKELLQLADQGMDHEDEGDDLKREADEAQGVTRDPHGRGMDAIRVHFWYGKWRMLKKPNGQQDYAENDLDGRDPVPMDICVGFVPDLDLVISVQDLRKLYPNHESPRPFVEAALGEDGAYWRAGLGERLEDIEEEATAVSNLGVEAGEFSVMPPILATPRSGIDPDNTRVAPGTIIWCENPGEAKQLEVRADLNYVITYFQQLLANAERLTGGTDQALGRQPDRPNAPRTVGQTQLLLEAGDQLSAFDMELFRDDMAHVLRYIWRMDTTFLPEQTFFRVTEEEADGLFPTNGGFASLDSDDRTGNFDFDIKFATSRVSKEAEKERAIQLYQLDLGNPLIINNMRALWRATNRVHKALGDDQFARTVPEPPDNEISLPPSEEHTRMLQGEDVVVRPGDDDLAHVTEHDRFEQRLLKDNRDPDALQRLQEHKLQHARQLMQKRAMQAMVQEAMKQLPQLVEAAGPLMPQGMGQQQPGLGGPEGQAEGLGGAGMAPQPQPNQPPAGSVPLA